MPHICPSSKAKEKNHLNFFDFLLSADRDTKKLEKRMGVEELFIGSIKNILQLNTIGKIIEIVSGMNASNGLSNS
jgi:hypothetical protein